MINVDVEKWLEEHPETADKPMTWRQFLTMLNNAKKVAPPMFVPVFDRLIANAVHTAELPAEHGGAS